MEEKFDPISLPNNCFSLAGELEADDERQEPFKKQRLERGFDDTELWNLDGTILKFTLPRLKAFQEATCSYPCDVTAGQLPPPKGGGLSKRHSPFGTAR